MEDVGEEIWQQASLRVADAGDVRDHSAGGPAAHGSDYRVYSSVREMGPIGFSADPVVA